MVRRRRSPKDSTTHRNHRRAFAGAFKTAPLFEAYDIYQHLMDYWAHIMEDDCYLVAAEGWKAGAQPREIDAHCKSICEALAPVGALEIDIAQAIAEDRWRLKRARAIETGIFAAGKQGLLGFNPGNPSVGTTEDPAQVLIEDTLIQARTWLAKNDNFLL